MIAQMSSQSGNAPSATSVDSVDMNQHLVVKRYKGLGNVISLLPVLQKALLRGSKITVVTRPEWAQALAALEDRIHWVTKIDQPIIDLDKMTDSLYPSQHRTDELAQLLGVPGPFSCPRLSVPVAWATPFEHLEGCVVFAPEGGHPSRCWPLDNARRLHSYIQDKMLVLVGLKPNPPIPADIDLRSMLQLRDLFGLLSVAGTIVAMDSAIMHIAAALSIPTVGIFGGIDPCYRIMPDQTVLALQANMTCCPCNKNETCRDNFHCIEAISPDDVAEAIHDAQVITRRTIRKTSTSATEHIEASFVA